VPCSISITATALSSFGLGFTRDMEGFGNIPTLSAAFVFVSLLLLMIKLPL